MSQLRQRDVGWKYDAEPRSYGCRHGQCRTLNDLLDDHLGDGSRSLGPTNRSESIKRVGLFRNSAIDAIAHETIAKSDKRGHRTT